MPAASWRRWLSITFLTSLAISAYRVGAASTINGDGMLYLQTAQVFVEQGVKAAFHAFNWPFFSLLIGALHQSLGLSYETAAYTLDALLLAALCVGFVELYREMTDGKGRPWIAAAVILASPELNDYGSYIIRDIGYWSLSVWAVLFFVRYDRRGRRFDALAWQVCIVGAIAFRIEGIALAALLPLWQIKERRNASAWLHSNVLFLLGLAIIVTLLAMQWMPLPSDSRLGQLSHFLSLDSLAIRFAQKVGIIAGQAQSFHAPQDAKVLLIGGIIFLFLEKTISCLGLVYASLLAWALWKKRACLSTLPVLWCATGITAIPLLVFIFNDLFLSGRYMGLFTVLLSLWVASAAEAALFDDSPILRRPRLAVALVLAMIAMLAGIFMHSGESKRYIRNAAAWVKNHVPASFNLCSDEASIAYYAGRGFTGDRCNALEYLGWVDLNGFDGFVLRISRKDKTTETALQAILANRNDITLAAQFNNAIGDKIFIVLRSDASQH